MGQKRLLCDDSAVEKEAPGVKTLASGNYQTNLHSVRGRTYLHVRECFMV